MVKKGKKSKTKIPAEDINLYEFVTLEENFMLERKHDELVNAISKSSVHVKDSMCSIETLLKEKHILDEWLAYLHCDHLPKAHSPVELRNYFFKELYYNEKNIQETFNWMLNIDERSILNQDIGSINFTRRFLEHKKINFGDQYNILVTDALKTLDRIYEVMKTRSQINSEEVYADIKSIKIYAQNYIRDCIDRMTYRIISSEKAYMVPKDAITEEYTFQGNDFQAHIWALQNVPIRFDKETFPALDVQLENANAVVIVPFETLQHNLVMRGLHLNYDHFSEYTRSAERPVNVPVEDLKISLQNEWQTRKDIQKNVREKQILERLQYEEYLIQKAEEEAIKEKEAKNQKDQTKAKSSAKQKKDGRQEKKKFTMEPPVITSDTFPLIEKDFLEFDENQYNEYLNTISPAVLGIEEGEINMREFQILGGVFELDFVKKPKNTIFLNRIQTWHENDCNLKYKGITCLEFNAELNEEQTPIMFVITFQLAPYLCHWGPPIPCQWEKGNLEKANKKDTSFKETQLKQIESAIRLKDFQLNILLDKPTVYNIARHVIPRTISSYRFPSELVEEKQEKSGGLKKMFHKTTAESEDTMTKPVDLKFISDDNKRGPERLFPVFHKPPRIETTPSYHTISDETAKKFSQLIQEFKEYEMTLQPIFVEGKPRPSVKRKSKFADTHKSTHNLSMSDTTAGLLRTYSRVQLKGSSKSQSIATLMSNKSLEMRQTTTSRKSSFSAETLNEPEETPIIVPKWSQNSINSTSYDDATKKITIWTANLGIFGFAFNRYVHFPFKCWSMEPDRESPVEAIKLLLENNNCKFEINVTGEGYTAQVTDFTKYIKKRHIYLDINEPISELKNFVKIFQANNLNIFPDRDAYWYAKENGLFFEKHFAMEGHIFECMSIFATTIKFRCSEWNRLAGRRIVVMKFNELREEEINTVKITPEGVQYVDIKELCTDLASVQLEYTPTWKNLGFNPDLVHLFENSYSGIMHHKVKDDRLIVHLSNLLKAIRLLSFS